MLGILLLRQEQPHVPLIDNNDAADAPSAHPKTCDTIFVEFVGNWVWLH
jgi:hypothetical protein